MPQRETTITEFIIGERFSPIERESLQMGCIASTLKYFPDGSITRRRYDDARTAMSLVASANGVPMSGSLSWPPCV